MAESNVLVAVRIRPKIEHAVNATQSAERHLPNAAAKLTDDTIRISEDRGKDIRTQLFAFDMIFDLDSTQDEVYEETTVAVVDAALQGCNATIMTYGQTGSGKTFTVLGAISNNPLASDIVVPNTGLFLRALRDIFNYAEQRAKEIHTVISLSVIEVYLENVRDLLSKDPTENKKLLIDQESVVIPDQAVREVTNLREALQVFKQATAKRVIRATDANDQSSRSHALFFIEIFQQPRFLTKEGADPIEVPRPALADLVAGQQKSMKRSNGDIQSFGLGPDQPRVTYSKVCFTDLAGSEKIRMSGARGDGLEELKKINSSLTSLGNVVHALYSDAKHVPYRDSKLTLLLRGTFAAPKSKVVMIANVSPTVLTYDETLSTLHFANKVKAMKSQAQATGADFKLETWYLATLRSYEELGTDLRIAGAVSGYKLPCMRRHGDHRPIIGTESEKATKIKALTAELQAEVREERKREDDALQAELAEIRRGIIDKQLGTYREVRKKQEARLAEVDKALGDDKSEFEGRDRDAMGKVGAIQKEIDAIAATRKGLEVDIARERQALAKSNADAERVAKEYDLMLKELERTHHAEEQKWKQETELDARKAEYHINMDSDRCDLAKFQTIVAEYLSMLEEDAALLTEKEEAELDLEYFTVERFCIDTVENVLDNIVALAAKNKPPPEQRKLGQAPRLPSSAPSGPPPSSQPQQQQRSSPPPKARSGAASPVPETSTASLAPSPSVSQLGQNTSKQPTPTESSENAQSGMGSECQQQQHADPNASSGQGGAQSPSEGSLRAEDSSAALAKEQSLSVSQRKAPPKRPPGLPKKPPDAKPRPPPPPSSPKPSASKSAASSPQKAEPSSAAAAANKNGDDDSDGAMRSPNQRAGGEYPSAEPATAVAAPAAKKGPKRPPPKPKIAPSQAAAQPTTPFDNPGLLDDILGYMQGGTTLLKHGRSGKPHNRFFFLHTVETANVNGPPTLAHRIYWAEDANQRTSALTGSSFVDLSWVYKITIGQYSDVFARTKKEDELFYSSFSLHYVAKKEQRSLDVVAPTDAEFEAWVIGCCHLAKKNPRYGAPLAQLRQDSCIDQLSEEEVRLAKDWHVRPGLVIGLHKRLKDLMARKGATVVKVSSGGFKFLSGLDIFRAAAMLRHFVSLGMVVLPANAKDYLEGFE